MIRLIRGADRIIRFRSGSLSRFFVSFGTLFVFKVLKIYSEKENDGWFTRENGEMV